MDTQKTGEFLRALRKAKGLTQEEVAEQLFLSPKTVSRWESGAGLPDINIISGVAALYGVTVDEILQGERKTDRSENLTEQTKRLKNDGRARMIQENLLKKIQCILYRRRLRTRIFSASRNPFGISRR